MIRPVNLQFNTWWNPPIKISASPSPIIFRVNRLGRLVGWHERSIRQNEVWKSSRGRNVRGLWTWPRTPHHTTFCHVCTCVVDRRARGRGRRKGQSFMAECTKDYYANYSVPKLPRTFVCHNRVHAFIQVEPSTRECHEKKLKRKEIASRSSE